MSSTKISTDRFQHQVKTKFEKIEKKYELFSKKDFKDYLTKWNMEKNLKILTYTFVESVKEFKAEQIIWSLFESKELSNAFQLEAQTTTKHSKIIEMESIPCTVLSMDFFDRIYDHGITLPNGTIRKCFEEFVEDIVIADELRNMLLVEDSENYSIYQPQDRNEFLFRIFQHLCLGGVLNQYEDNIGPYVETTKAIYKDLVCARKTGASKKPTIMSKVFKIVLFDGSSQVHPFISLHPQDFTYIILNYNLKEVTVFHHTDDNSSTSVFSKKKNC